MLQNVQAAARSRAVALLGGLNHHLVETGRTDRARALMSELLDELGHMNRAGREGTAILKSEIERR